MYFFIITITLLTLFIILAINYDNDYDIGFFSKIMIVVTSIFIFVGAMCFLGERLDFNRNLRSFEVFKNTLNEQRELNISEIERAAILPEIIKWNQWVKESKYVNNWNDWAVPDTVITLKLIK